MLNALGWLVAAFLGGMLLAGTLKRSKLSVRKRFAGIESYRGLRYGQLLPMIGHEPAQVMRRSDGITLRCWQEPGYSITLAFDENDLCLGVEDEKG